MRAFIWTALLVLLPTASVAAQDTSSNAFGSITIVPNQALQTSLAEEQRWQGKLQKATAEIDVIEARLGDALKWVSEQIEVPIRIDQRALDDVGLDVDTPVTLKTPQLAADSLLQILLREVMLTYRIDSTGVVVTTWEAAESRLIRRVYPIGDLVNEGPLSDPHYLIGVITSTVEVPLWEYLGGPASINHYQNSLIVDQTNQAHDKIQHLLAQLRQVKKQPSDAYATEALYVNPPGDQAKDIEAKLNSVRVPIEFIETPLEDVIAFLADVSEISIHLDRNSLADIGIPVEQPITIQANELSVKQTLSILSEQYDLAWYSIRGMIVVTAPETAESELEIRVYPVRDLVWHGLDIRDASLRTKLWQLTRWAPEDLLPAVGRTDLKTTDLPELPDFDNLIKSITSSIQPDSWQEYGGPGSIADYPMCDGIVVMQTREIHEAIAQLLQQVRAEKKPSNTAELTQHIQKLDKEVISAQYQPYQVSGTNTDLEREDFQAIADQVEQLIEPDSWGKTDHFIIATQGGLIVRHQRDTQDKISKFLDQIGIGLPVPATSNRAKEGGSSQLPAQQSPSINPETDGFGPAIPNPGNQQQGGFF
ncbi:hypothetical protein [Bremerella sp.]|uniref:hypothetical protein n=1 Tax=Bremerella sp. TaxID=2795602 RepID=UPI00391CEF10